MFLSIVERTRLVCTVPRFCQGLVLSGFLLMAAPIAAQSAKEPPLPEPGKSIERELAGGQSHAYRISLTSGQFLHLVVEQRGIDVVVALYGPDGRKLVEVDSPNGSQGPEPIFWINETAGAHRLEVRSLETGAMAGRYQAKIEELRVATEQDRKRFAASQSFAAGRQQEDQQKKEAYDKALEKYEAALALWRDAGDRAGEAEALYRLGAVSHTLSSNQKALEYFQQAQAIYDSLNNRGRKADALSQIGVVYFELGDKQKAVDYQSQALAISRELSDEREISYRLNDLGNLYASLGEKEKALDFYNQALPIMRKQNDLQNMAIALGNAGAVYRDIGEKQKALEYYNQALPILEKLGDRRAQSFILSNTALVYDDLGEPLKALEYQQQALQNAQSVGYRYGEGTALHSIGKIYSNMGEMQQALDYFMRALPIMREIGSRGGEAYMLNNLGVIYHNLGEPQKALDHYEQSLKVSQAIKDGRGEGGTLTNIGQVYDSLGEKERALDYYNRALPILREIRNRGAEGITLQSIAVIYKELGQTQKAVGYYDQALAIQRAIGDRRYEGVTLNGLGQVHLATRDFPKAFDYFNQALALRTSVKDQIGEAGSLYGLAYTQRERGDLASARQQIEGALRIVESTRKKISSQDFRASYFASVRHYYEFYIDLLMQLHRADPKAGHDRAALQASERSRARALLEMLTEARADIRRGVEPALLDRERSLRERLNAKAERQTRLLGSVQTKEQAQSLARDIEALTTEFHQVEAEIRQKSPAYASLTQPPPITVGTMQQQLDKDTLLLQYSLGDERSYLWAVTRDGLKVYELSKRQEIENAARELYEALKNPRDWAASETLAELRSARRRPQTRPARPASAASAVATRLSQLILAPVASQLSGKRLLIVADGALQYIPFGALPAPKTANANAAYRPLIINHEIVTLPSASTLAVIRNEMNARQPATKTLALIADPVFESDDERVKSGRPGNGSKTESANIQRGLGLSLAASDVQVAGVNSRIPRLPGTRAEARQITALVPRTETTQALDFTANRQWATSNELSQYRYVHFATHGFLDSRHPELSGIVLSLVDEQGNPQNGFLRAHEVFNLKLPAELVTLSACQTGLGKEVRGEGLVGLTRAFMYAGAPRVVVSLWNVNDEATAELMARFYRGMLRDKLRPAAALRAAQVSLMTEEKWSSPFFWAAFTLQGEWR